MGARVQGSSTFTALTLAVLLAHLGVAHEGEERVGVCLTPEWWQDTYWGVAHQHAPVTAVNDALARIEPSFSAAVNCLPLKPSCFLVCPAGAVVVDVRIELRSHNDTATMLAPAPRGMDDCFGHGDCPLPDGTEGPCDTSPTPGPACVSAQCAMLQADGTPFTAIEPLEAALKTSPAPSPTVEEEEEEEAADHIVPLEEWKAQVLARLQEEEAQRLEQTAEGTGAADGAAVNDAGGSVDAGGSDQQQVPPPLAAASARPKLPLGQRFNYGSFDAGARLVAAHSEAKGSGAILGGDKDKYMLSPCSARKWVVIALPEDIKVDAITLANHELFSSTVKEFQLLGSMKYPTDMWFELGKFEAADTKQTQEFFLSEPNWARYLKLRLISHHRHEHYCTLTSIAVFGQTVMDDFAESMELQQGQLEDMRQRVHSATSSPPPSGPAAPQDASATFAEEEAKRSGAPSASTGGEGASHGRGALGPARPDSGPAAGAASPDGSPAALCEVESEDCDAPSSA
eukprot:CAMPEP_0185172452 /NCGR_PEP_ID=MMETSP1139-20130426/21498_1 /TAXON_ID=298111 /ORGANISM="Pavlova sp., Strain CCMP459" /LENGTH=512 /DNA_ID=CAMNT_0027738093 /DNA_START=25 /DNA_END=1560 /DNA_ORIENTATION=+